MASVQKFSKVDHRTSFLNRLKDPELAAAYLASVMRDKDKNEIERALSNIAEANNVEVIRVGEKLQTALESILEKIDQGRSKATSRSSVSPLMAEARNAKTSTSRRLSR